MSDARRALARLIRRRRTFQPIPNRTDAFRFRSRGDELLRSCEEQIQREVTKARRYFYEIHGGSTFISFIPASFGQCEPGHNLIKGFGGRLLKSHTHPMTKEVLRYHQALYRETLFAPVLYREKGKRAESSVISTIVDADPEVCRHIVPAL